jgi:amino acid transporter
MALLSAGIFYSLILFSTGAALPWQEYSQYPRPAISLMFIELYGNGAFGTAMFWIAWSGAMAGLLTTWNGFYIASARLLLGMSRARLIPEFFSKIHPKYGTPMGGNAFLAFVCLIGPFIGMGIIDPITSAGGVGFCIGWFITSASCLKLRIVEPDMVRPYKAPGGKPLMAIATVLAGIIIIISFIPGLPSFMGPLATSIFFGWTALGLILYFASTGYRKAISEEERVKVMFASTKDIDLEQFDQQ